MVYQCGMALRFYDAHNHLHDERFGGRQAKLLAVCAREGVAGMVVNGSCEEDWPHVLALAKLNGRDAFHRIPNVTEKTGTRVERVPTEHETTLLPGPQIIPSFGYHPWYIHERTDDWLKNLTRLLDETPGATIGEIGLDRWKPGLSYEGQEEVFIAQLRLAAERNLPVSIHCLQAWGRMLDLLKAGPRPARGFLLHSYGGPKEMVKPLADLGAYFSLPGYYARERKERQRETFKSVPRDRLLIETDAPDQLLPQVRNAECGVRNWQTRTTVYELKDSATGKPLNHPANLRAVYEFAAEFIGVTIGDLAAFEEENFLTLFGNLNTDGHR
jgi:TatD DNase family protein